MDAQEIDARIFAAEDALIAAEFFLSTAKEDGVGSVETAENDLWIIEEEYGAIVSEMFPGLPLEVHKRA